MWRRCGEPLTECDCRIAPRLPTPLLVPQSDIGLPDETKSSRARLISQSNRFGFYPEMPIRRGNDSERSRHHASPS